jgi:hypothetical protein
MHSSLMKSVGERVHRKRSFSVCSPFMHHSRILRNVLVQLGQLLVASSRSALCGVA